MKEYSLEEYRFKFRAFGFDKVYHQVLILGPEYEDVGSGDLVALGISEHYKGLK